MPFRETELSQVLKPEILRQGRRYLAAGQVVSTELQKNGSLVAALVRGTGRKTHKLLIRVGRDVRGGLDVTGQCTCPAHYNCAHVAAALLALADHSPPAAGAEAKPRLPETFDTWLERLREADRRERRGSRAACLLYLVQLDADHSGGFLLMTPAQATRLKGGGYGPSTRFTGEDEGAAGLICPEDHIILGLLADGRNRFGSYAVRGSRGSQAFEAMLKTGRCHWDNAGGLLLRRTSPLTSPLTWVLEPDGTQSVRAEGADPGTVLLPLAPPWYLDPASGECGPVQTGLPDALAEALAAAPPVSIGQADALARALEQSFPGRVLPAPREPAAERRRDIRPVPCLRLRSERDDVYFPHEHEPCEDFAEFWLDYNGLQVHPMDEEPMLVRRSGDSLELILRHADDEIADFENLVSLGLRPDEVLPGDDYLPMIHREDADGWLDFVLIHVPALQEQGWRIEIDPSFRYQLVRPDGWFAALDETPGNDWFSLELGVEVAGERVNLLPTLAGYLQRLRDGEDVRALRAIPDDHPLLCPLGDGRVLHLPLGRARHVMNVLTELNDPDALDRDGQLRMARLQSPQLLDLDPPGHELTWDGGEDLRRYGARLRAFDGIREVTPPAGLQARLRPYQQAGLNWLQFLREFGLGGILADDMGLGKTLQTLAHLLVEKTEGRSRQPSLVVAPTSVLLNWHREAQRFTPGLRVLALQGHARRERFDTIPEHDLILTTYPLLPRDADTLLAREWHLVILDEAQQVKNPRSRAAQTACRLKAKHRLCLTGTPLENHLGEVWSQFQFLLPGLLGDERRFRTLFRTPIEKHGDEPRRTRLQRRIAPFILRRQKAEVVAELPPKSEIVSPIELAGAQRDLYETVRLAMHERVFQEIDRKGIRRSQIVILDALLKLRQICCDPRLLKLEGASRVRQSAKLEWLAETLPELVDEGRRILLFSQFTTMLGLIEEQLKDTGMGYVKLTGQTRDRATPIDRFQGGEVPVFLISLKAGGTGLNLTAADTVIHYDPWWNPAVERQATDRAHRIGQDKPVFVYKLITQGTVEERIAALQVRKQALADALLGDGGNTGKAVGAEDLQALFEPLPEG